MKVFGNIFIVKIYFNEEYKFKINIKNIMVIF